MKSKILTLTIAAVLSTGSAFAQDTQAHDGNPVVQEEQAKPRPDRKRWLKAGGMGCLAGGAVAFLSGKKDKALAGCAVGAAVGGIASYRAQLQEAEQVANEARAAGMTATVNTKEVEADGEKAQALEQLAIDYDPASMSARDSKTVAVLDKIGALSAKSKTPLTITVEGSDQRSCQIAVAELTARGANTVDRCGAGKARILISPVPDVR